MKYFEDSVTLLKRILTNKKVRFSVILTMYITIFTLIALITIININKDRNKLSLYIEDYKELNNYNYSYTIKSYDKNNKLNITSLSGKRYKDDNIVYYESKYYDLSKTNTLPIETIDFTKIDTDDIYNYLKNGELSYQNNYIDVYKVNLFKFVKLVNNNNVSLDKNITISLIKIDKKIVQIELDLTNYVNFNEDLYNLYTITINYNQINENVDF